MIDKSNTDITKMEDALRERIGVVASSRDDIESLKANITEVKQERDLYFDAMIDFETRRATLIAETLEHKDKNATLHDLARRAREVPMEAADRLSTDIRNTNMKINIQSTKPYGSGIGRDDDLR
jgi:hypothetical protein